MADFTTHFLFGEQMLPMADPSVKAAVTAAPNAFYWGLQGPDPLLFHNGSINNHTYNRYSTMMHLLKTEAFLYFLADYAKENEDEAGALTSYFYGFLCHYALDRRIHPYVYFQQNRLEKDKKWAKSAHIHVECQLDRYFWNRLRGTNINHFRPGAYYKRDKALFDRLGDMLAAAMDKVYNESADAAVLSKCFGEVLRYSRFFYSPTGFSYGVCSVGDALFKMNGNAVGHIKRGKSNYDFTNQSHDPWIHPWHPDTPYHESVWDIFSTALVEASSLTKGFSAYMSNGTPLPRELSLSTSFGEGCPQADMDKALLR